MLSDILESTKQSLLERLSKQAMAKAQEKMRQASQPIKSIP
jgi:hypothetical protein